MPETFNDSLDSMFVLKFIFILNFKGEQAVVVGAGLGRIRRTLNDSLSSKISLKFIFILNFKGGPRSLGGEFFFTLDSLG